MTKDEIILAQQARIEQLGETLQHFALIALGRDSVPSTFGMDVLAARKVLSTHDDLSALRAHEEKLLATYQWQPIETAPKDGTEILLLYRLYGISCVIHGLRYGSNNGITCGEYAMNKPKLIDLFCCAGGAGMGYAQAGFDVTGVDVVVHQRNPHPVMQKDALSLDPAWIAANFDAIHASPPCQGYTTMRHAPGAKGAPRLIHQTRELLEATGLPWVIENVEAASCEMRNPMLLCGTMFGLSAQGHDLQRHRLFEMNFHVDTLECRHSDNPVVGVYGGHARNRSAKHGGRGTKDVWVGGHKVVASEALGIDWMSLGELSEAIPPAYTQYIGAWLMQAVELRRVIAGSKPVGVPA